jgi:hypothetical protein
LIGTEIHRRQCGHLTTAPRNPGRTVFGRQGVDSGGCEESKIMKRPPLNLEESQALEDLTVLSRGIGKAKAITELNPYLRRMATRLACKNYVWISRYNVRVRIP